MQVSYKVYDWLHQRKNIAQATKEVYCPGPEATELLARAQESLGDNDFITLQTYMIMQGKIWMLESLLYDDFKVQEEEENA